MSITASAHTSLLAGPAVTGVADDPEAAAVLEECIELWRALPHAARSRVHLACTPMADPDEAAAIVNALQRHAAVVVQKSIAEGFGLTVAEAMWKSRPIVASAVGGIVDQVVSGAHGLLVADPSDLASFGNAVERSCATELKRVAWDECPGSSERGVPRRPPPGAVRPAARAARLEAPAMGATQTVGAKGLTILASGLALSHRRRRRTVSSSF